MLKRSTFLLIAVIMSCLVFTLSCGERDKWAGKYGSTVSKTQESPAIFLELMPNGNGSWATEEDSASFKWEIRGNEVWLRTKSGGIIVGNIKGDSIEVNLPGMDARHFKRIAK